MQDLGVFYPMLTMYNGIALVFVCNSSCSFRIMVRVCISSCSPSFEDTNVHAMCPQNLHGEKGQVIRLTKATRLKVISD